MLLEASPLLLFSLWFFYISPCNQFYRYTSCQPRNQPWGWQLGWLKCAYTHIDASRCVLERGGWLVSKKKVYCCAITRCPCQEKWSNKEWKNGHVFRGNVKIVSRPAYTLSPNSSWQSITLRSAPILNTGWYSKFHGNIYWQYLSWICIVLLVLPTFAADGILHRATSEHHGERFT